MRVDVYRTWPDGYRAMQQLEGAIRASGLEVSLIELMKTRASQLNQCTDVANGEASPPFASPSWRRCAPVRVRPSAHRLPARRKLRVASCSLHSPGRNGEAGRSLPPRSERKLTYVIVTINAWNRLGITAAGKVGGYQPGAHG